MPAPGHLRRVGRQVDVSPLQVGGPVNLAPLLARREGFQDGLGEGKGAVGHAHPAELAHDVPGACGHTTRGVSVEGCSVSVRSVCERFSVSVGARRNGLGYGKRQGI